MDREPSRGLAGNKRPGYIWRGTLRPVTWEPGNAWGDTEVTRRPQQVLIGRELSRNLVGGQGLGMLEGTFKAAFGASVGPDGREVPGVVRDGSVFEEFEHCERGERVLSA